MSSGFVISMSTVSAVDSRAGPHDDALDSPFRLRADPADDARHERARTADFAQQLALADAIDPNRRARDGGGRGLEAHEAERRDAEHEHADGREAGLTHALLSF